MHNNTNVIVFFFGSIADFIFLVDLLFHRGKNMTVIKLTHRPTLSGKTINYAFYVNRSSGESMTEI